MTSKEGALLLAANSLLTMAPLSGAKHKAWPLLLKGIATNQASATCQTSAVRQSWTEARRFHFRLHFRLQLSRCGSQAESCIRSAVHHQISDLSQCSDLVA